MPNTRTGMSHYEDSIFDADNPPRVHLGPYDPRTFYGSVADPVATVDNPRRDSSAPFLPSQPKVTEKYMTSALPFCANPLPMPLDDMVPSARKSNKNDRSRAIRVSERPIFAGR
jgi:hypothetical protein